MVSAPSDWEIKLISAPPPQILRQLQERFVPQLGERQIYIAYAGSTALRLSGFLVADRVSFGHPTAFCPLQPGLEPACTLWRLDVNRQLTIAAEIAAHGQAAKSFGGVIWFREDDGTVKAIPRWIYGIACVPVDANWDGVLMYPRPFCPELFLNMAAQPEARQWLLLQQEKAKGKAQAHRTVA